MSLEQLNAFGGLSLVSFFTIKIILREAAPLIVGIVLTVKAGPHVVSRVGRALPVGPERVRPDIVHLLMPSVLGISIAGPCLYLISVILSLLAGVISQSFGSMENFLIFFNGFLGQMQPGDLLFGLVKSFTFGLTIVLICGYAGSETACTPQSMGKSVLNGIVASYIAILMLNVLFVYGYNVSQLVPGI